jgi:predicted transport protein
MSDIKLFRLLESTVQEIPGSSMAIEKSLQRLIEQHLETFLGVRFLASEFSTTKSHGGRIDTLGIDDTDCPVIVEYKRALNENVINQGLYYLNWLMEHRAEFKLLVMEKLGTAEANRIEWRYPRLICIAAEFTKFDIHAIEQMQRNIDLVRYRLYGDDLVLLDLVGHQSTMPEERSPSRAEKPVSTVSTPAGPSTDIVGPRYFDDCSADVHAWYRSLQAFISALGDDVEERVMQSYIAFRRLKTFAYFKFQSTTNRIAIDVPLPAGSVELVPTFALQRPRGFIRIVVDSAEDVKRAQPIIALAYERS